MDQTPSGRVGAILISSLYTLSDPPLTNVSTSAGNLIQNPFRAQASPAFRGYDYQVTIPITTGAAYIQVKDAETCHGDSFKDSELTGISGVPYVPPVDRPLF